MQGNRLTIAALLLVAALTLSSCDLAGGPNGQAAPPATQTPPQVAQTPSEETANNSRLAVAVEEEPFTLSDLQALPRAQISAGGQTYEGVAILDLLAAAQVTNALTITLVARDAITVELRVPALTPQSILAFSPDNILNAVLPDLPPEQWLQDVVVIDTEPEGEVALRVGPNLFALEELQAMQAVQVDDRGQTYEGVRVLDLLSATGLADATTIIIGNRFGDNVELPVKDLTAQSILAFGDGRTLNAVLPGLADKYWLEDVIEVRTTP